MEFWGGVGVLDPISTLIHPLNDKYFCLFQTRLQTFERGGGGVGTIFILFFEGFPLALPWSWYEYCAEITDSHGEQDTVCGGLHTGSAEDDDDDGVGDQGDHSQHRHDHPQQGEHEHHRAVRGGGVKSVAGPILKTPGTGERTYSLL